MSGWKRHPQGEHADPSDTCTLAGAVEIEVWERQARINVGDRTYINVNIAASDLSLNGSRRIALAVAGAVLDNIRADLQALTSELDE